MLTNFSDRIFYSVVAVFLFIGLTQKNLPFLFFGLGLAFIRRK